MTAKSVGDYRSRLKSRRPSSRGLLAEHARFRFESGPLRSRCSSRASP
ncbi:MAG: hypothetical protein ACXAC5_03100 [Promethearchaeota archaeon]